MSSGAYALLGVVIGGLLAAVTAYVLERARERRDVRAAARLIATEIIDASLKLVAGMEAKSWPTLAEGFPQDVWREQRATLARGLNATAWGTVLNAYLALDLITRYARTGVDEGPVAAHIARDERHALQLLMAALDKLQPYTGSLPATAGSPPEPDDD